MRRQMKEVEIVWPRLALLAASTGNDSYRLSSMNEDTQGKA
jgi:hypothetical protein